MNNELFTDLNPTDSQDINGGWLFSVSASYSPNNIAMTIAFRSF